MKRLALVFLATACSPAVPDGKPLTTSSGLYLALASEGLGNRFLRPDGLRNEDLAGTERYEIADRLMVLGYRVAGHRRGVASGAMVPGTGTGA